MPSFPPIIVPPGFYQPVIYYNSPVSMAPAGNGDILIGYASGPVYSFNPAKQSTTLLQSLTVADVGADGVSSGLLWQVGGFLNNRWVAYDESSVNTSLASWDSDTANPAAPASASVESSIWDFDLPEQEKILDGFIVVCDLPQANDNIVISYKVDQASTWTTLDSITALTATGLKSFLPVSTADATSSTTVSFTQLQFRTSINQMLDLSGVINPLTVYSVTAQARVSDFSETFEILVRLQDEEPAQRTSTRQAKADVLRKFLWDSYRTKEVVYFTDGYISSATGLTASSGGSIPYAVTIEGVDDFIDNDGEGKARVQLRVVRGHDS